MRDPHGMRGGVFSCRAEAFRFATLHYGRPCAAIMVPYLVEFDFPTEETEISVRKSALINR